MNLRVCDPSYEPLVIYKTYIDWSFSLTTALDLMFGMTIS